MLIGEKVKETSTTISYHEEKRSENLLQVVVGIIVYRSGKRYSRKEIRKLFACFPKIHSS